MINLSECSGSYQQWTAYSSGRRGLFQEETNKPTHKLQADCSDVQNGWYDLNGNYCAWYAERNSCDDYGSKNKNFGNTANQVCCACGGGTTATEIAVAGFKGFAEDEMVLNDGGCYGIDGFKDSVGDGCMWYAQGDICADYGSQFRSAMGTVNESCCKCGGASSSFK